MLINKYGVEYIQFHDDIFYDYSLNSPKWLRDFIDEVKMRKLVLKFRIYLRANNVKDKRLLELKRLDTIFVGVESGVQQILDEMQKGVSVQDGEEAIYAIRKRGIRVEVGFITIVPTMTFDELKENYEFLYRVRIDNDTSFHNRLNIYNRYSYEEILREKGLLREKKTFGIFIHIDLLI